MRKYLAIVGVIFLGVIILGLAVYVDCQDERYTQEVAQKAAAHDKNASSANPAEKHSQENVPNPERHALSWYGWYGFFRWPNGTTTWAIILTLIVIAEQTRQTRKAAEASLKQADAQMFSERAWIVIKSKMSGYEPNNVDGFEYNWVIKNTGNTPARIIETQCRYEFVHALDLTNLPLQPQYPAPIILNGFLLPPGDSADYQTYLVSVNTAKVISRLEEEELNMIRMGLYNLRVFGYVKYLDVFEKERESRFCEYYVWPSERRRYGDFRPLLGIPADYTMHT
jgi:hypothetical protein